MPSEKPDTREHLELLAAAERLAWAAVAVSVAAVALAFWASVAVLLLLQQGVSP